MKLAVQKLGPYKVSSKPAKRLISLYSPFDSVYRSTEVLAWDVTFPREGLSFIVHEHDKGKWRFSEKTTGSKLKGCEAPTKEQSIKLGVAYMQSIVARKRLNFVRSRINEFIPVAELPTEAPTEQAGKDSDEPTKPITSVPLIRF